LLILQKLLKISSL